MPSPEDPDALELFRRAATLPDQQLDAVEGALLIAQAEYPGLDRAAYHRRLGEMSREAEQVCSAGAASHIGDRLGRLSRVFAEHWGFHGNRDDYYDPRNSFLNDVLDRRTGIPITLSLVYIHVGRGAGLNLVGVGMPGHFLVGCADRGDLYVDAFSAGALLTRADCAARLRELQPDAVFRPEFLEPVGPRLILTRMLNNLLEIYLRAGRFPKALTAVEMASWLQPAHLEWLRQRAVIHYQLKNYSRAVADLEAYLDRNPGAADRDAVLQHLTMLRQLRSMVN
ncbi:MAG TPA: transglutaminase-like domain-containing protein [Candidatus Acidoferrales bacterium]|nr:transglutaminase-like domain-containing protein [Candidatus Acidoferrales bacterium]